jgi:uncharacterized protein DUF6184
MSTTRRRCRTSKTSTTSMTSMTRPANGLTRAALLGTLVLLSTLPALLGGAGCGGVTDARVSARNRASKAACDRANACGNIGPGQSYADYQSCISIVNGDIDATIWPVSECQQINQQNLDVCISAINGTQCGNGINFLITLGTCGKQNVCVGQDGGAGN